MEKRRTNNLRSFASPGKYVQGPGLLDEMRHFTDRYGKRLLFVIDAFLFDKLAPRLKGQYPHGEGYQVDCRSKAGEITVESVAEYAQSLAGREVDVFVAVGGGKTIDTVKILARDFGKPVIVAPTVASTDAPTSGLSVVYKENGEHSHEVWLDSNPDLVLVDSRVIAQAPVRLLVSGMGDALATCFEARANELCGHDNVVSEELGISLGPSLAAKAIAKLCYDVLLRDGVMAKEAAGLGLVTEAVENIVEANTLLSGIGFESNGTAAAHAINDGLTVLPQAARYYHGERVAFGTLCQLVLENANRELLREVYTFCRDVGLPITLRELGIDAITPEELDRVAQSAYDNVIHAEPMVVTHELIRSAILVADSLGEKLHRGGEI